MKKTTIALLSILVLNISFAFGQNFFPLNIGNYWNLKSSDFSPFQDTFNLKVTDTLTIAGEKFFKCPLGVGDFHFDYLRVDSSSNILIAAYQDTSYPIIDFKENSQDIFYYPITSYDNPDSIFMGQIVKNGFRKQGNSNTIGVLFNADTLVDDDELYITLEEGIGLVKYYILGGYIDYGFLNACIDGVVHGTVANKYVIKHTSNHLANNKLKKELNLFKDIKTDDFIYQINGKKTSDTKLSKGIFFHKPSLK